MNDEQKAEALARPGVYELEQLQKGNDVTRSCPLCDQAPRWKARPDAPGLWVKWEPEPDDHRGTMFIVHESELAHAAFFEVPWFGPIPEVPK